MGYNVFSEFRVNLKILSVKENPPVKKKLPIGLSDFFGDQTIYNPWSIINYAKNWERGFLPYWVNTSGNDLVKRIITRSGQEVKEDLEQLLRDEGVVKPIDDKRCSKALPSGISKLLRRSSGSLPRERLNKL